MMAVSNLTLRLSESKDMQGILTLWEKYSGWGAITEKQYVEWFIDLPYGKCLIVVAENEHREIVGQALLTPTPLLIQGSTVMALRIAAPIFQNDIREATINNTDHLSMRMLLYGMDVGREQGYTLMYTFPARGWLAMFRKLPRINRPDVITDVINCFSISLIENFNKSSDNQYHYSVKPITKFDQLFDKLWKETVVSFPINCGIVRDSRWLNWKIAGHLVLAVTASDEEVLLGYVALNKQSGLIVDALARTPEELSTVLSCVVNSIHHSNSQRIVVPFSEVKGMYTTVFQHVLKRMEHTIVNFQFAFMCYLLNSSLGLENFTTSQWYMMPND